jgi:class 3 adenylate cyclase
VSHVSENSHESVDADSVDVSLRECFPLLEGIRKRGNAPVLLDYPWARLVRPVTLVRVFRCQASRADVWAHVSNTMRLNRAAHHSALTIAENDTPSLERFRLRSRIGGFVVTYLEHPYNWQAGEYFSFYRVMLDGPARTLATRYDLADAPDGTCDVTLRIDITPRLGILRPVLWLAARRSLAAVAAYLAQVDRTQVDVVSAPADERVLAAARARIRPRHAPELVARLVEHVRTADDFSVAPIRPFALAGTWGADRLAVLRLCLEAVPAGMLELRWALLCPSCRTASQVLPSLRDLDGRAHCHACDLRYDTDLDRAVEAQFFPHPSVRRVETRPFCIAGPSLTPHVIAQEALAADATGTLRAPADSGRVRLFVRGGAAALVDVVPGAPDAVSIEIRAADVSPATISVAPRGALHVVNRSGEGRHAKLEHIEWLTEAATAHHVAALPEFRPLFGAEALRPGLALKVSSVAILFSDLCGSTALYSRVGDAVAFGIVTDCLSYGTEIVERHGGTLVKTIGDAVMAAFADERGAVAAAAETLQRWPEFVAAHPAAASLDVKIGVNAGPCTVVTANGTIDYFGQTVNQAARIQHLARAHEAVVAEALLDALPASGTVRPVERFEALVKGIAEPLRVVRLRATQAEERMEQEDGTTGRTEILG